MRRLVIVMARGLVVTLATPRPRKAKPAPTFLRKPGGTGILMPRGAMAGARPAPRTLALPLFDPLRPFRPRPKRPVGTAFPASRFPASPRRFPSRRAACLRRTTCSTRPAWRCASRRSARRWTTARTGKTLRPLAGAKACRPRRAASGRCVRAARPVSGPPAGAPTRCTRSCTTSTASPSTSLEHPDTS